MTKKKKTKKSFDYANIKSLKHIETYAYVVKT